MFLILRRQESLSLSQHTTLMGREKKEKIQIKIGSLLSFLKYPEMKNKVTFFWTKCNKA
jgi:hypothetical protein